jgi:hypothetical protein
MRATLTVTLHPSWSWNRERERIRSAHGTSISVKKRKGRKVTAAVVAGGPGPGGTPPARGSSAKYLPASRQRKSTPRCHLAREKKKSSSGAATCACSAPVRARSADCRKRGSSATRRYLGHSSSHQCPLAERQRQCRPDRERNDHPSARTCAAHNHYSALIPCCSLHLHAWKWNARAFTRPENDLSGSCPSAARLTAARNVMLFVLVEARTLYVR